MFSCVAAAHHLLLLHRVELVSIGHAHNLITHSLLLLVESVRESPKLLRLHKFTLHLPILVLALLPLQHLELARRVLHSPLDHVDLVAHQPKAFLHLLLHTEDLLRDQGGQRGIWSLST